MKKGWKKGKWNYTEDVTYTVCLVKILPVESLLTHWQNAFIGEERQAVIINHEGHYQFLIDNSDGYGLQKIMKGGGPDSYSAHLSNFEIVTPQLPEEEWNQPNRERHRQNRKNYDTWMAANFPEELKRMLALREALYTKPWLNIKAHQ